MRRCRHDVVYDVLKTLSTRYNGLGITKLCMFANLPVDRGNELLKHLIKAGLVYMLKEGNAVKYFITPRGYEYISMYERIRTLLRETHNL